jgi:hypothetical protein
MTKPTNRSRLSTLSFSLALGALAVSLPHAPSVAQVLVPQRGDGGAVAAAQEPPLSLTASDGSGLELVSLSAQAVVEDPLALTELHLIFRNPENRVREGRFRITLPAGATVSRFAMRIGDRWQEGEVVEQQAARIAYEDFLHRRQDPALLETEAGNEFSARVFPIPPSATKELIVSYSQELTRASEPYRLPLRGLPRLGSLTVRALVGKTVLVGGNGGAPAPAPASTLGGQRGQQEVVEVSKRDFRPDRDFEVAHTGSAGRLGLRSENLVVARIVPSAESDRRDEVPSLMVLIDTSASRALGLADEVAAWEALMAEVRKGGADPVLSVAAFDQDVAPIFSGRASAVGDAVRRRIGERRALGASDLDRALRWAAETMRSPKERRARLLLVTDGVVTAGETDAARLRQRIKALAAAGVERLDVLAVGGIREDALLAQLVTAGLARDGVVLDGGQPASALARRLTRATRSGLKLEVEGAGWTWPSVINGVQPGDEILVYADLPADKPLRLNVAGQPLALTGALAPVERPLLERAWVKARIARLLDLQDRDAGPGAGDPDMKDLLKKQAIELSIKNRVLCRYTSLLVLETEQDYARFGIERRALADILTVGAGGIALLHRTDIAPATATDLAIATPPATPTAMSPADARKAPAPERFAKKSKGDAQARDGEGRAEERGDDKIAERELSAATRGTAPILANRDLDEGGPRPVAAAAAAPAPPPPASGHGGGALGARASGTLAESPRGAAPAPARPSAIAGLARDQAPPARALAPLPPRARAPMASPAMSSAEPTRSSAPATPSLSGPFQEIAERIRRRDFAGALAQARAWRERDPGDVLALVALGECAEAAGNLGLAARAYGSIIDLFPGRADMRRFAGERLEHVHGAAALALAVDTYRKAVEQRPDHPASHRLLAFALIKQGHPREAFQVMAAGAARRYPDGRFAGVDRILREDLGLIASAWTRAEPARAVEIRAQRERAHGIAEGAPSVRFVLNWETDANDVDFHIHDGKGGHAYYGARQLASGGELYADVTTGYGPECFTIRGPAQGRAFPYRLQAHYYSRGPMGYGMGKLQVIEHDGRGALRFDERPFVIMQDGAFVDLGAITGGAPAAGIAIAR